MGGSIWDEKKAKKSFLNHFIVEILPVLEYNVTCIHICVFEECVSVINIVLVEPEIPMNTGNIARTCAATRSRLHLIKPLGFDISDRAVKRAGLDYWHMVDIQVYENLEDFFEKNPQPELWLATTKAPRDYTQAEFKEDCWLMFGKETAGLPEWLRKKYAQRCVRIPMRADARSLNLANSVAILTYEALRQQGFPELSGVGEMGQDECDW